MGNLFGCLHLETKVIDTRRGDDSLHWRKRRCLFCDAILHTEEKLVRITKNGKLIKIPKTLYSTIEYLGKDAKSLAPKRKQPKVADPEKKTLPAEIKRLEQIIREQDAVIARLHANAIEAKQPKVKRWN
jgi:hypothetical protein